MSAEVIPVTNHLSPGEVVSDTRIVATRNIRHLVRTPQLVIASVAQTVMFLLLFRYVFGGSIVIPDMSFVNFLIPGYIASIAIFDGFGVCIGLAEDAKSGIIERFRALPMARSAFVGGRAVSDILRQAVLLVIVIGVGLPHRLPDRGLRRRRCARVRRRAALGLCAVLGVRRHRPVRARRRDRAGGVDAVLHPVLRVVGGDPGRHPSRLAPALRPEPADEPGRERAARVDGRSRGGEPRTSTARATT